jgi:diguanylate cyclase (GGDEF)-like protein
MSGRKRRTGGLGTRIALRTFVLFCLCAMLPTGMFAFIGYRVVSGQLGQYAHTRLAQLSKSYGVLVNERLAQTDLLLTEYARMRLAAGGNGPGDFALTHIRIISSQVELDDRATSEQVASSIEVISAKPYARVRQHVTVRSNGRSAHIVAEPAPEYLWDASAVEMAEARVCVYAQEHVALYCSNEDDLPDTVSTVSADWKLFLKPRFGIDEWTFRMQQREGAELSAMRTLRSILPIGAVLAIVGAMLLSSIHIRRSHRPLVLLTQAADSMRRGELGARVKLSGRDEYAGLGRAFNRMASHLRRQFRHLNTLSMIDQLILSYSAVEPVAENVLPRILQAFGCEAAALILWEEQGALCHVHQTSRSTLDVVESHRFPFSQELISVLIGRVDPAPADVARCEVQSALVLHWLSSGITVGQKHRGLLLLGFTAPRHLRRRTVQYASELAHRFAVALGNEDRARALLKQAYRDGLTGLPNRQLFKDRLQREMVRAQRSNASGALLFIDLDRFKNINDSLGHSAGDEILAIAAKRLKGVIRESDTLARLGGDEFTLILPDTQAREAVSLISRIHDVLGAAVTVQGIQCVMRASIGIVMYPQNGADAETLLRNADTAMYRAKATGRGNAVFFEEAMNEQAVRRLRLEQRLRRALDHEALTLHFQPKVDAQTGAIVGVEALARWFDPEEGTVSPVEFIAIAEDSGLISQLGEWALRSACHTLSRWRDQGLDIEHVAVNVSMGQLRDPGFVALVARTLSDCKLPAQCLEIELTESTVAHEPTEVARLLQRIRDLGVRIAIDDFGTGYSSMAVLAQLPVDVLKIDRAFVMHCQTRPEAGVLLRALISIAQALGKTVVAEGIETSGQADFLRAHGAHLMQGYLFGKPVAASELEATLRAGRRFPNLREQFAEVLVGSEL